MTLDVIGISGTALQGMCSRGYRVGWSDNYGQDFTNMRLGWICNYQLLGDTAPDTASLTLPGPIGRNVLGIDGPGRSPSA